MKFSFSIVISQGDSQPVTMVTCKNVTHSFCMQW